MEQGLFLWPLAPRASLRAPIAPGVQGLTGVSGSWGGERDPESCVNELGHLSGCLQRSGCLFSDGNVGRDRPYFQGPSALTTFLGLLHRGPTVLSGDLRSHSGL